MPIAHPHRRSHAFTLLELLTVVGILAILAAISIGMIRSTKQRAQLARAKSELAALGQALEDYKRHYGDYPQTGPSAANSHKVTGTTGPGVNTAQARLFNALIGVYGPNNFNTRLNGPKFVEITKFSVDGTINNATFAVPTGTPPTKVANNNAFLDPWGNRYMYFYKQPTPPGGRPQRWDAPTYVLYSVGPRGGLQTSTGILGVNVNTGAITNSSTANDTNADYIFADKLP